MGAIWLGRRTGKDPGLPLFGVTPSVRCPHGSHQAQPGSSVGFCTYSITLHAGRIPVSLAQLTESCCSLRVPAWGEALGGSLQPVLSDACSELSTWSG